MNRILLACLLACFSVGAWAAPTASTCPANTIRCAAGYAQTLNVSTVGNGLYFPTTQQGQVVAQFVGLTASGATITPQVGVDLVNWTSTAFTIPAASSITADGYYVLPVNGAGFVNFSVTGAGTGSVTVTYQLSPVAPSGAAAGGTINQGAPGTQPWPTTSPGGAPINIAPITITTPGTAVCFGSQVLVSGITIVAQRQSAGVITSNTSAIEIGNSSVTTTNTAGTPPGQSVGYNAPGANANGFCITGITAGDGAVAYAN